MLDLLLTVLVGSVFAIQAVFWPLYAFVVLPALGDRSIKVKPSLGSVLLGTYMDCYVSAYLETLAPGEHLRWHNQVIRFAMPATSALLAFFLVVLLVAYTSGA